ncbi:MAG: ribonuclease Z, partial [Vallitaleaceae bacterium]|nr:ribonuclease Z [Vallitaleaceae bacterium]
VIAPELPFEIKFIELNESYENIQIGEYIIEAFRVKHNIICYGYSIVINRQGKFEPEKAQANNIPLKFWSPLQKGETREFEGRLLTPDMVLGEGRKGLKITYCTDTRPVEWISEYAKEADLFVCEGMYGEETEETKASAYKHMTFTEAAKLAKAAKVSELWLTHFSPSLVYPKDFLHVAQAIFPQTVIGKDRMTKTFKFEEDTSEE